MKTVFLRVLEADDKATALLDAMRESALGRGRRRFEIDPASFAIVPRSPFAYWVSERMRRLFKELPPFEGKGRTAKQGLATGNDARFIRVWWEVPAMPGDPGWVSLVKGGAPNLYFSDPVSSVKWFRNGSELKAFASAYRAARGWGDQWTAMINATEYYFLSGITWPLRGSRFAPAAIPRGCAFSTRGCAAIADVQELPSLISIFSSHCFDLVFKMLLGRFGHPEFTSGALQEMPVPTLASDERSAFDALFHRGWSLKRSLATYTETSHAFMVPALLQVAVGDLATRAANWSEHVRTVEAELARIHAEIDERCFALYGIDEADRQSVVEGFASNAAEADSRGDIEAAEGEVYEDGEDDDSGADVTSLAAELVSWAVGVAFGRFDVRLASGARPMPTEPEPFDPLPACSPSMLTGVDGLPLARPPVRYPLAFPENGVLVDDLGHAQDLPTAVRAVFDVVFGSGADCWWNDVAALLDPKGNDLRGWLAGTFFEHHLKRHSKSNRKAPIVWQLATSSGRYSLWLYAHRLTRDTFFQLQNQSDGIVGQKLALEDCQLANLIQSVGSNPSAGERKEIATQAALVEELRAMLDEIKRVAPLWNPNLDDGVVLTMAPLWRLVPQHKSWQKELKSKWDELCTGKYDWAHVAMHLWPERVVPKCITDRSLAIAHGLEDVFWVEDFNHRWRPIGSRNEEREQVAMYWAALPLCKVIQMARELWEQRYRDSGRPDDLWWQDVEAGAHDDHSMALLVWPERVCRRAFDEPQIAAAHGFTVPKQTTSLDNDKDRLRYEWIQKMLARYVTVPDYESLLSGAFSSLQDAETWQAWWKRFDGGELDHRAVAHYLRPTAVAERCQNNLNLAIAHGVERFFFVDRGAGLSARLEAAEELAREVAERTSPAVKAALSNLMNAPITGAKTRDRSRGRASPTEVGGRS